MSKSMDVSLAQINFPATCVVCLSPAPKTYQLEKIFTFGKRSYTIHIDVPMCEQHFQAASHIGTVERLIGVIGILGGVGAGLFCMAALLFYWYSNSQGNILLNLFAASVLGIGVALITWLVISHWIAPLFAERDSKEARHAVQITHYFPQYHTVRLRFENEHFAELMQKQN